MPYFKNGKIARCPQCGMNMSLRYSVTFNKEYWQCNWIYCSERGIERTEAYINRCQQKTPAEFAAYRATVTRTSPPPTPNYISNPSFQTHASQNRGAVMKTVNISSIYNDTIIKIKFVTLPRRGWFAANVTPLVDIIKASIPPTAREYNSDTYTWQIGSEYWPSLKQILIASGWTVNRVKSVNEPHVEVPKDYAESFFHEQVRITTVETKESVATQLAALLGIHEDLATMELAALKRKYREMARLYHPDLGGDATKMTELNRVWTIYNMGDKMQ